MSSKASVTFKDMKWLEENKDECGGSLMFPTGLKHIEINSLDKKQYQKFRKEHNIKGQLKIFMRTSFGDSVPEQNLNFKYKDPHFVDSTWPGSYRDDTTMGCWCSDYIYGEVIVVPQTPKPQVQHSPPPKTEVEKLTGENKELQLKLIEATELFKKQNGLCQTLEEKNDKLVETNVRLKEVIDTLTGTGDFLYKKSKDLEEENKELKEELRYNQSKNEFSGSIADNIIEFSKEENEELKKELVLLRGE
jgi:hypothetical protein